MTHITGQEPQLGSEGDSAEDSEIEEMDARSRLVILTATGYEIGQIIEELRAMKESKGCDLNDLKEFENYVNMQDAVGFVTNPTAYRDLLFSGGFDEAKRRIKLIRAIWQYFEEGDKPGNSRKRTR